MYDVLILANHYMLDTYINSASADTMASIRSALGWI